MKSYDVIIVGAGPAGSTCAANLRKSGLDVKLYDKKVFPRVKPCAGWVTPQVVEALQIDVGDYRRELTFQPIRGFRTGMIGGRLVETKYDEPVSFGILRVEFDHYLLQRSGVPCDHTPVKQIERSGDQWIVNDNCTAPVLIGAGGHFCPVARHVRNSHGSNGSPAPSQPQDNAAAPAVVYAQEVEFKMSDEQRSSDGVDAELPELYFCGDMKGYGWCFRKGNFLNVGLGRLDKTDLSTHVQEFGNFLTAQGKLVDPLPSHFLGHAYQLYVATQPKLAGEPKFYDEGVLLIGDSAGLAYAQSGEGIRPAVESAMIAADVIATANGDYSADSLSAYRTRLYDRLGRPKPYPSVNWLPTTWLQSIAARLMATRWFAKNVVVDKWFLHRQQGTLASFQPEVP